uniref:Integrin alpha-2 domain-containing protein n=1 Tax=Esox lucius TaxID=8010 RepID=A0A6Q2YCX8_ESOLU
MQFREIQQPPHKVKGSKKTTTKVVIKTNRILMDSFRNMCSERNRSRAPGKVNYPLLSTGVCLIILIPMCAAFNLDVENPAVYSGPNGSYFGYSVEFYLTNSSSVSVVIGAPKANTSQLNITEGGSVYYCPWSINESECHNIEFDSQGDRTVTLNETDYQAEFKSHQWFGATIRSHGDTILACAPLYSWRTKADTPQSDTTGTCYLSVKNFTKFVEYAPCRTEFKNEGGQGYCQGGFSADFTKDGRVVLGGPGSFFWQGQVISAAKEEIIKAYYPGYFMQSVEGQIQTRQADIKYDDSFRGKTFPSRNSISLSISLLSTHKLFVFSLLAAFDKVLLPLFLSMTDVLVGAPMYMIRGSDGRLEEVGRVYVYLQRGNLSLESTLNLTGTQVFGRFGNTIAPLGDLNQDGYDDVAISCPFGGENQQGLVLIYNGYAGGLKDTPSQVIVGQWASGIMPASFGFAVRGAKDLDMNGYPDLIVGAFGVDKAILYRSRPIVTVNASLNVNPTMINPEEKTCSVNNGNTTIPASCVNLSFCLAADGKYLPDNLSKPTVLLDRVKHKQKGGVKRALFVDSQQALLQRTVRVRNGEAVCHQTRIYLRDDKEFRDKLSPIAISLNFSLDPKAEFDSHNLRPILNYQTSEIIERKAQILLGCGEDNICVPDLKLAVHGDRKEVYLGDDNSLTLTFNARNVGEGGAYEAELYVVLPPEADYSGIARNNETLTQLTCSYETENQTRYLSCDLGNPMKSGTSLWAGLRFTVPRLKDTRKTVQFELQIRRYDSSLAFLDIVSRPDKVVFPPSNWKSSKSPRVEQDIGPAVQHVYELVNKGPSGVSHTVLQLSCPLRVQGQDLLYPLEISTEGPVNCTTNYSINSLQLKVNYQSLTLEVRLGSCSNVECWTLRCNVGLLEKGTSAILKVRSRIRAETFMEVWAIWSGWIDGLFDMTNVFPPQVVTTVVWNKPDGQYYVPLWIIILAILAGLLLLALLIYVLYKVSGPGFRLTSGTVGSRLPGETRTDKCLRKYYVNDMLNIVFSLNFSNLFFPLFSPPQLGFFKRSLPYGTAMEKAQLKPQAASEA